MIVWIVIGLWIDFVVFSVVYLWWLLHVRCMCNLFVCILYDVRIIWNYMIYWSLLLWLFCVFDFMFELLIYCIFVWNGLSECNVKSHECYCDVLNENYEYELIKWSIAWINLCEMVLFEIGKRIFKCECKLHVKIYLVWDLIYCLLLWSCM